MRFLPRAACFLRFVRDLCSVANRLYSLWAEEHFKLTCLSVIRFVQFCTIWFCHSICCWSLTLHWIRGKRFRGYDSASIVCKLHFIFIYIIILPFIKAFLHMWKFPALAVCIAHSFALLFDKFLFANFDCLALSNNGKLSHAIILQINMQLSLHITYVLFGINIIFFQTSTSAISRKRDARQSTSWMGRELQMSAPVPLLSNTLLFAKPLVNCGKKVNRCVLQC